MLPKKPWRKSGRRRTGRRTVGRRTLGRRLPNVGRRPPKPRPVLACFPVAADRFTVAAGAALAATAGPPAIRTPARRAMIRRAVTARRYPPRGRREPAATSCDAVQQLRADPPLHAGDRA